MFVLIAMLTPITVAKEPENWDLHFSTTWKSAYVSPGGALCHDSPVIETSLTKTNTNQEYFDITHYGEASSEWLDRENGFASEIDFTLGKFGKFDEDFWLPFFRGLDYNFGISYWAMEDMTDFGDTDTIFVYAKLSKTHELTKDQSLTFYVKPTGYFIPSGVCDGGFNLSTGVYHNLKLAKKFSLCSEATLIYNDGIYGSKKGFVGKVGAALDYQVNEKLSAKIFGVELWSPISANNTCERQCVYSTGLSFNF